MFVIHISVYRVTPPRDLKLQVRYYDVINYLRLVNMCVTTCDEVCVLCFEIKLLHEENLTERNERKDCDVVG